VRLLYKLDSNTIFGVDIIKPRHILLTGNSVSRFFWGKRSEIELLFSSGLIEWF
jgi:hypothetical protein